MDASHLKAWWPARSKTETFKIQDEKKQYIDHLTRFFWGIISLMLLNPPPSQRKKKLQETEVPLI